MTSLGLDPLPITASPNHTAPYLHSGQKETCSQFQDQWVYIQSDICLKARVNSLTPHLPPMGISSPFCVLNVTQFCLWRRETGQSQPPCWFMDFITDLLLSCVCLPEIKCGVWQSPGLGVRKAGLCSHSHTLMV